MTFLKTICICFIVCAFYGSVTHSVFAETKAFKITDPFNAPKPTKYGVNFVHYVVFINFKYQGQQVLLSKNPDGTGDANVGDFIQIAYTESKDPLNFITTSKDCMSYKELSPQDISQHFKMNKEYLLMIRLLDNCGNPKSYSSIYLVLKDRAVSPSPTPTGFLDLPWEYSKHSLSFNDAALSINSFFDHSYPLLSSGIYESSLENASVTNYMNEKSNEISYSSHDGYDYGKRAQVHIGDAVLAAAAGTATYSDLCSACGNMILINHDNGYQTRYMHLQKEGLITNERSKPILVAAGQHIGKVGATGKVIPANENGAHIHFMVIQDKDADGNFENNIPNGITDPFGWQSDELDPWSKYLDGNTSKYLWKKPISLIEKVIQPSADSNVANEHYVFYFPANSVDTETHITLKSTPSYKSTPLESLGPVLLATAKDITGNIVNTFQKNFTLRINFKSLDISNIDMDTLSIYSSQDKIHWEIQPTTIDITEKTATTSINHFTYFALLADKKDTLAPITQLIKTINKNDISFFLDASDNELGVDYTLYKINQGDWQVYIAPVTLNQQEEYTIDYYSVDKGENIEDIKTANFTADTRPPEVRIQYDNEKNVITVIPLEEAVLKKVGRSLLGYSIEDITISDKYNNSIIIQTRAKKLGVLHRSIVSSISYTNSSSLYLSPLKIVSKKTAYDNKYRILNQIIKNNTDYFHIEYQPLTNTSVVNKKSLSSITTETYTGIKSAILSTNESDLKVNY